MVSCVCHSLRSSSACFCSVHLPHFSSPWPPSYNSSADTTGHIPFSTHSSWLGNKTALFLLRSSVHLMLYKQLLVLSSTWSWWTASSTSGSSMHSSSPSSPSSRQGGRSRLESCMATFCGWIACPHRYFIRHPKLNTSTKVSCPSETTMQPLQCRSSLKTRLNCTWSLLLTHWLTTCTLARPTAA